MNKKIIPIMIALLVLSILMPVALSIFSSQSNKIVNNKLYQSLYYTDLTFSNGSETIFINSTGVVYGIVVYKNCTINGTFVSDTDGFYRCQTVIRAPTSFYIENLTDIELSTEISVILDVSNVQIIKTTENKIHLFVLTNIRSYYFILRNLTTIDIMSSTFSDNVTEGIKTFEFNTQYLFNATETESLLDYFDYDYFSQIQIETNTSQVTIDYEIFTTINLPQIYYLLPVFLAIGVIIYFSKDIIK